MLYTVGLLYMQYVYSMLYLVRNMLRWRAGVESKLRPDSRWAAVRSLLSECFSSKTTYWHQSYYTILKPRGQKKSFAQSYAETQTVTDVQADEQTDWWKDLCGVCVR